MNTYSDIYLHIVFGVKYRDGLIGDQWIENLHSYIASIFKANGHHAIIIGGVSDHVHCLIGYNPRQSIPDMVKDVKVSTTNWINGTNRTMCKFAWQKGYGVFSYSPSQVDAVKKYIANQKKHHRSCSLSEELANMLRVRGVSFDPQYLPQELV